MVDGVDRKELQGKKVLVVEDEALITMLFEDILSDFACEIVGPAMNIRQATELARAAEIDMAILDVNLNGEPSYPVAAMLRSRGVPLVFSSGYGSHGLPPEWQDRPTLPKPFTSDEVGDALSRLVSGTA
jgi:DNA-binding NarL/FixJ family response regulator